MVRFVLKVENRPPMISPSMRDVAAAVLGMTPQGGPSFVILEGPNKEFAQAAGGDGRYTAEWLEHYGEGSCQWKAGRPNVEPTEEVKVRTNGFVVRVWSNEILNASEVIAILGVFLSRGDRPKEYTWRPMANQEFSN